MLEKVRETLYNRCLYDCNHADLAKGVIVGYSGGYDSTVLLHVLTIIGTTDGFPVFAVHVNHGIRGEEAQRDENKCVKFAEELGCELKVYRCDVPTAARERKMGIEECGRDYRKFFFSQAQMLFNASYIAVAHNKNDRAETILMNIARGCALTGLTGMNYRRDEIIRPLLDINRKEIEDYCRDKGLHPCDDRSNYSDMYTRNRVRNTVFPVMNQAFGHNITDKFVTMSENIGTDHEFLMSLCERYYDEAAELAVDRSEIKLDKEVLISLHTAISGRVLLKAIDRIKPGLDGITACHIKELLSLLNRDGYTLKYKAGMCLPGGINALLNQKCMLLTKREQGGSMGEDVRTEELVIPGISNWGEYVFETEMIPAAENSQYGNERDTGYFLYDDIKGAVLRSRQPGDYFYSGRRKCGKKLKNYLIDKKIPYGDRENIPLIVKDTNILWIVGIEFGKISRVHEGQMVKVTVKRRGCTDLCEEN